MIRDTPSPKAEKDLIARAMKSLTEIPGLIPSELTQSQSPKEDLAKSQARTSEQSEPDTSLMDLDDVPVVEVPSLTRVTRMNKDTLLEVADLLDIDVHEGDTVAILKRKVRSYIKQLP